MRFPGVIAAALALAADARADDFLVVPRAEDPGAWRGAASVAGLVVAGGPRAPVGDDAVIRIEPNPGGWILRATNAAGVVRTARVPPPTGDGDREEIAHLAAALARDLGRVPDLAVGPSPRPAPKAVPPPPPPPLPTAARASAAPPPPLKVEARDSAPEPVEAAPLLLPPPTAVPESPVGDVVAPATDLALVGAFPPRAATTAPPPADFPRPRRERRRLQSPPLTASTGGSVRGGIQGAFVQTLGWEPHAWRSGTALALTLGYSAPRDLGDLDRVMFAWHGDAAALARVGRPLRLGPVAGISYRLYRQQGVGVSEVFTPYVGLRADLALFGAGGWRFGPAAQGTVDLGRTILVAEDNTSRALFPAQLDLALQVRFVPRSSRGVDPNPAEGTLRDREPTEPR